MLHCLFAVDQVGTITLAPSTLSGMQKTANKCVLPDRMSNVYKQYIVGIEQILLSFLMLALETIANFVS
jgi:hypothetical protein